MSDTFRLQVGDLASESEELHGLMRGELADIVYSDPPWGQGNLMYWRTHNGEKAKVDWGAFMRKFCRLVANNAKPNAHIFIEMGLRWVDDLAHEMASLGRLESRRWVVLYGSPKLPNALWYCGPGEPVDVTGLSGVEMTTRALRSVAKPGALVLDPCCGKGMTARVAMRLGMRFAGNELNPKRLAVTSSWCSRFVSGAAK